MGIRWRVCEVSLLVLFLYNFPRGLCQEGSDSVCQPRSTNIGEDLDLRCDCPTEVVWSKLQDNCICHDDEEKSFVYHVHNITAQHGGVYQCECTSSDVDVSTRQCFNVTVNVQISSFEASPSTVRVNSSFTLTCSAVGYPAPTQFRFINDPHFDVTVEAVPTDDFSSTARYTLTANSSDLSSGDYKCSVYNTMSHVTMSTHVMVHEPPTIVRARVKNVTVDSFIHQQRASLECIVQSWNSSVYVHWIHHSGYIIKSDHKYTTSVSVGNASVYTLHIHNLQESDAGEYICLLTSSYTVEDSKIVMLAPTEGPESETDYSGSGEEPTSCICNVQACKDLVIIAIFATATVAVLTAGLCCVIWRVKNAIGTKRVSHRSVESGSKQDMEEESTGKDDHPPNNYQVSGISNTTVSGPNQGNRESTSGDSDAERDGVLQLQTDGDGDSDAEREIVAQLQTDGDGDSDAEGDGVLQLQTDGDGDSDGEQLQDLEPEDSELPEVVTKGLRKRLPSVKPQIEID